MKCPYCKSWLQENSMFCPKCGQTITHHNTQNMDASTYWEEIKKENEKEEKIRTEAENEIIESQRRKKKTIVMVSIAIAIIGCIVLYYAVIYPSQRYNAAGRLLENGKYYEAQSIYYELDGYKDSYSQIMKCEEGIKELRYMEGLSEFQGGRYYNALSVFRELEEYKNAPDLMQECYLQIAQNLIPVNHWDFSNDFAEVNGLVTKKYGNTKIKSVSNSQVNKAAYFDGDGDYIECGSGLFLPEDYTFNIVLCCHDIYKDYSAFFAKYENNSGPYAFSINQGYVNCWITEREGEHIEIQSQTKLKNNQWYSISIVKDGGKFKLYVDGQYEAEGSVSSVTTRDDIVTIGRQALMFEPVDQLQFTGYIADISIYEQSLSEDEVYSLYVASLGESSQETEIVDDIPDDALEWNSHHYAVFDNCMTMDEAFEYCKSRGGHLATIMSEAENSVVFSYMQKCGYESAYFGLSDKINEGFWIWTTGEASDYLNWHSGEPNGESDSEDYAMFYYKFADGTWNDGDFGEGTANGGRSFICEWD